METGRNDRFCGSNGGADIGVFGMMSSVILTVQLIINIINASNRQHILWGILGHGQFSKIFIWGENYSM